MFVEREKHAGFSTGSATPVGSQTIDAAEARAAADRAGALEGRGRPDQEQIEHRAAQPLRLPALIAKETPAGQARGRSLRLGRRAIFGAVLLLAIGAAGSFGYRWWTVGRFIQSTDDAYVSAHNT